MRIRFSFALIAVTTCFWIVPPAEAGCRAWCDNWTSRSCTGTSVCTSEPDRISCDGNVLTCIQCDLAVSLSCTGGGGTNNAPLEWSCLATATGTPSFNFSWTLWGPMTEWTEKSSPSSNPNELAWLPSYCGSSSDSSYEVIVTVTNSCGRSATASTVVPCTTGRSGDSGPGEF